VKYSGGKLVPRSDLRVGTTSGNSCRIKSKKGRDIKVGTWNVRSLYRPGAFQSMVGEVEKYGMEVVALQETRWTGEGSLNVGSYAFHYGGSEIHSFGVGFMINKKILSAVKNVKFINERLGLLVVQGRWYKIAIINGHAPTEDKDDEIKDGFYEELERLVDQLPNDYMKIVLGDFNAKIGKEDFFRPTIGFESLHEESNDNGVRVINFATGKNLIVKSTYFRHKNIHKQTWISPDGNTRNQIDHVLADKRRHTNVLDVRSYRGADCDSDHSLVI
ncbi:Craniofacial development protein 2, partial [Camponotus floridanus]